MVVLFLHYPIYPKTYIYSPNIIHYNNREIEPTKTSNIIIKTQITTVTKTLLNTYKCL